MSKEQYLKAATILSNYEGFKRYLERCEFLGVKPNVRDLELLDLRVLTTAISEFKVPQETSYFVPNKKFETPGYNLLMSMIGKVSELKLSDQIPQWSIKLNRVPAPELVSRVFKTIYAEVKSADECIITYAKHDHYYLETGVNVSIELLEIELKSRRGDLNSIHEALYQLCKNYPAAFHDYRVRYTNTAQQPIELISFKLNLNDSEYVTKNAISAILRHLTTMS